MHTLCRRALVGSVVGVAALSIAACGTSAKTPAGPTHTATPTPTPSAVGTFDPNRPLPQQIVAGLQKELAFKGQLSSQMTCIGQAFYRSNLSDDALNAIAQGDANYSPSTSDEQTLVTLLSTAVAQCSPDATPTPTSGP